MAGMSGRMSTVIKSKISKMLDKAEDPGETLEYSYQKQMEMLQNVKKGIADVVTAKKRLQMQSGKLEQQVVKLDTQARQALAQGNEPLARTALERKTLAQTELQTLDSQVKELEGQQEQLTANEQKLRQAAFTVAFTVSRLPTYTGCRNVIRSIAAVTTRSPEWRTAAMPATSSQRCMITPPWTLPAVFASPIPIQRLRTELDRDGGRGSTGG